MTGLQREAQTTTTPDQTPAAPPNGRFRKRPVEIDAVQWRRTNLHEVLALLDNRGPDSPPEIGLADRDTDDLPEGALEIPTLEGTMIARPGDWIIRGVRGELYPCKPEIFEATYESPAAVMRQRAPYPELLERLIGELGYRAGWSFSLEDIDRGQGSEGLTFIAIGMYPDSYHPDRTIRVAHYFPVPPAAYNEQSWRRWLLDRILEIERHEACEFFKLDGERPYAPHHGPGNDPYIVFEHGSDQERRTLFTGEVKPEHVDESNADEDAGAGACG